jgi:hypothetical protein
MNMSLLDIRDIEYNEVNTLVIKNLDYFFESYTPDGSKSNKTPFQVLIELYELVRVENLPRKDILIDYNNDMGVLIFEMVDIRIEEGKRIVEYEFTGSAS